MKVRIEISPVWVVFVAELVKSFGPRNRLFA